MTNARRGDHPRMLFIEKDDDMPRGMKIEGVSLGRREFLREAALLAVLTPRLSENAGAGQQPNAFLGRIIFLSRAVTPDPRDHARGIWLASVDPSDGSTSLFRIITSVRPRLSPDGKSVSYEVKGGTVWVASLDRSPSKRRLCALSRPSTSDPVAWSPDGKDLVFSSGQYDDAGWTYETYKLSADGTSVTRLPIPAAGQVLDWSPDGKSLVVESATRNPQDRPDHRLSVMTLDGRETCRIVDAGARFRARFSPDGRSIAYRGQSGEETGIWISAADGKGERRLLVAEEAKMPVQGFSWSPDSKWIAFTRGAFRSLAQIDAATDAPELRTIEMITADGAQKREIQFDRIKLMGGIDWR